MGTEKKAGDLEEIQVLEGISESEEIDRRVEELMAPEEEGNGKKKKKKQKQKTGHRSSEGGFHPVRRFKGFSRKRKIITVLVLAAVVLFGFSRMSGGKKDLGIPVAVMPLAKQDVQEKLTVSGPVSGTDSVDVVSNIHAEITAMNVKEGDTVTKGQVLAVVDSTDLEREVQIAQNAYDLAVANKQEKDKEAALGYEKAVQDFQKASLDHSRNSQLFATGDISQMELEIKVSEFSIGKVKVGQMATITADILDGETAEGEVVKISPTGEEKGGGSTERVIPTTIRVDGGSSKLIAGITAKAELLIREAKDVFVVPSSALFDDGEVTYIAIVQDMKVKRIPVTMGVDGDVVVEVIPTDGTVLEEGMQVITNPGPHLMDGAAVLITQ